MKDELIKLRDVLKLSRNKRNGQYSFSIKKKSMIKYDLTPEDILNTPIILILKNQKGGRKNAKKKINKC